MVRRDDRLRPEGLRLFRIHQPDRLRAGYRGRRQRYTGYPLCFRRGRHNDDRRAPAQRARHELQLARRDLRRHGNHRYRYERQRVVRRDRQRQERLHVQRIHSAFGRHGQRFRRCAGHRQRPGRDDRRRAPAQRTRHKLQLKGRDRRGYRNHGHRQKRQRLVRRDCQRPKRLYVQRIYPADG